MFKDTYHTYSAYSYPFLRSVVCLSVCLSVVCHTGHSALTVQRIYIPLGRYACGFQWHIVLDEGPYKWPSGEW